MTRQEDINYDFLGGDRIWPPSAAPRNFILALEEVLTRLSDDAYDLVSSCVSFVIEDPQLIAVNVPFTRTYPAPTDDLEVKFYTIVVFHRAMGYPHMALVGLLAHEIAHSFVTEPKYREYKEDEVAANNLARQWGFEREIEALEAEG